MARPPDVAVGNPKTSWFISERIHTELGPLMVEEGDGEEKGVRERRRE